MDLEIQKKLVPDILSSMQKRYQILRMIHLAEPVGRRTLANYLGLTERVLRSETEFLKEQKLIDIKSIGMAITEEGGEVLRKLEPIIRDISGIVELENQLKKKLNIKDVAIVTGDCDTTPWVKEELGRVCAKKIKNVLSEDNIIAVTGGTTIATVGDQLTPDLFFRKKAVFVPARGGIGENMKNQANTICAKMAENTGTTHRVLYMPDQVSNELYESLVKEPEINEVLALIKSANIVLHGIGDALTMAKRRKTNEAEMKKIREGNAVGEAFGYYFNKEGKVVYRVSTIGLQFADLENIQHVIAVAGGASKAHAIHAYMKRGQNSILVTDEGAAKELLKV